MTGWTAPPLLVKPSLCRCPIGSFVGTSNNARVPYRSPPPVPSSSHQRERTRVLHHDPHHLPSPPPHLSPSPRFATPPTKGKIKKSQHLTFTSTAQAASVLHSFPPPPGTSTGTGTGIGHCQISVRRCPLPPTRMHVVNELTTVYVHPTFSVLYIHTSYIHTSYIHGIHTIHRIHGDMGISLASTRLGPVAAVNSV